MLRETGIRKDLAHTDRGRRAADDPGVQFHEILYQFLEAFLIAGGWRNDVHKPDQWLLCRGSRTTELTNDADLLLARSFIKVILLLHMNVDRFLQLAAQLDFLPERQEPERLLESPRAVEMEMGIEEASRIENPLSKVAKKWWFVFHDAQFFGMRRADHRWHSAFLNP